MTEDRLPLADLLSKSGDADFLRSVAESVLQIIMEADVDGVIGAGRFERSADRQTWRNGYRDRTLKYGRPRMSWRCLAIVVADETGTLVFGVRY